MAFGNCHSGQDIWGKGTTELENDVPEKETGRSCCLRRFTTRAQNSFRVEKKATKRLGEDGNTVVLDLRPQCSPTFLFLISKTDAK